MSAVKIIDEDRLVDAQTHGIKPTDSSPPAFLEFNSSMNFIYVLYEYPPRPPTDPRI